MDTIFALRAHTRNKTAALSDFSGQGFCYQVWRRGSYSGPWTMTAWEVPAHPGGPGVVYRICLTYK